MYIYVSKMRWGSGAPECSGRGGGGSRGLERFRALRSTREHRSTSPPSTPEYSGALGRPGAPGSHPPCFLSTQEHRELQHILLSSNEYKVLQSAAEGGVVAPVLRSALERSGALGAPEHHSGKTESVTSQGGWIMVSLHLITPNDTIIPD
ncbi:hypothetical protein BDV93DRAFT_594443 [Ceratobasidium sp. AG-I]|nr:hypothetical protein BDV93DRAFT_594443 [Ceratobasidium sp. AG-I]